MVPVPLGQWFIYYNAVVYNTKITVTGKKNKIKVHQIGRGEFEDLVSGQRVCV